MRICVGINEVASDRLLWSSIIAYTRINLCGLAIGVHRKGAIFAHDLLVSCTSVQAEETLGLFSPL